MSRSNGKGQWKRSYWNKNLTSSVYVLINEKEEESLLKEDSGELEDLYYEEDDSEDDNEDINENGESIEDLF